MEQPQFEPDSLMARLLRASTPDAIDQSERRVLRRCATTRVFDKLLFTDVLSHDLELKGVTFERINGHRFVSSVPGPRDRYQVLDLFRDELFRGWWSAEEHCTDPKAEIPPALRAISVDLAAHYGARDERYDELYHLIVADRAAALERIRAKLAEADATFDLPAYDALVRLLESRRTVLGRDLPELLGHNRLRLDTLTFWAQEYYDTERYYERELTRLLFDELIADEKRWILHLYARSGMGKTMYLLSVIARRCVPASIPCARVDFDYIPMRNDIERAPWRLLLSLAHDLNRQIAGAPFLELLRNYADYT